MIDVESIADRIKKYRDLKLIKIKDFEKKCGLSNAYLNKVKSPGGKILEDILTACPDLNRKWVLTGKGDMIIVEPNYNPVKEEEIGKVEDSDDPCEKCRGLQIKLNEKSIRVIELLEKNFSLSEELKEIYKKYPHLLHPHQNGKSKAG